MSSVGSVLVNVLLDSSPEGGWGVLTAYVPLTIGTPALATPSVSQSSSGRACTVL